MKTKTTYNIRNAMIILLALALLLFKESKAQTISGATCILANSTSESYSLSGASGISHIQWSVAGDIAITDSAGGTVTIKSQSTDPTRSADGKGRLYVSYIVDSSSQCGPQIIHKDIYKYFTDDDPIIGPHCVRTGDTVTYSINPAVSVNLNAEIGIDRYKWIIPSPWIPNILYYSSDSSSITFVVGTVSGNDSLIVGIGQCNLNGGNYVDTLVLGLKMPPPVISYLSCLPADSTSLTIYWTNAPTLTSGPIWQWPSNWKEKTISGDSIVLGVDNNPGIVRLRASNGCDMLDTSIVINRSLGSNSFISGDTCVVAGSKQNYTVSSAPVNTPLKWILPKHNGWSFANSDTSGQSVLINIGTAPDTIFVTAADCSNVKDTIVINLKPDNPSVLNGTTLLPLCSTDSIPYSVNVVAGATNGYGWIFPEGWSPATTFTMDTIVKVKPNGISGGKVKVYALGGCQNSDTISLDVAYETLSAPSGITATKDCLNVGLTDTVSFSIDSPDPALTYSWDIPAGSGWSVTSSSTDSSVIHVTTSGGTGTYSLRARAKDTCGGTSDWDTLQVTVTGLNFSITPSTSSPGLLSFETNPDPIPNVATYNGWTWTGTGGIVFQTGTVLYIAPQASAGTACVSADSLTTPTGKTCTTKRCITYPNGMRPAGSYMEEDAIGRFNKAVQVFPNPASTTLNIVFTVNDDYTLQLIDNTGKRIISKKTSDKNLQLDINGLANGTYYLFVHSANFTGASQVVISK